MAKEDKRASQQIEPDTRSAMVTEASEGQAMEHERRVLLYNGMGQEGRSSIDTSKMNGDVKQEHEALSNAFKRGSLSDEDYKTIGSKQSDFNSRYAAGAKEGHRTLGAPPPPPSEEEERAQSAPRRVVEEERPNPNAAAATTPAPTSSEYVQFSAATNPAPNIVPPPSLETPSEFTAQNPTRSSASLPPILNPLPEESSRRASAPEPMQSTPRSAPTEAQWSNLFTTIASDAPTQRRASAPEVLQSEPTPAASSEYVQFTNATRPDESQQAPRELSGVALVEELGNLKTKQERTDFADQQFTMKFDRLPNISDQQEFKGVYQDLGNLRGSISQEKAQEANQQTSSPDSPAKGAVATNLKLDRIKDVAIKIDTPEQAYQNFQVATGQTQTRSAPAQDTPSGPPPRPATPAPSEAPASVIARRQQQEEPIVQTEQTTRTSKPLPTPPVQAAVAATAEERSAPIVETVEIRTATAAVTQQPQQATRAQTPSLDDRISQMQEKIREEFGRENDIAMGRLRLGEDRANNTVSVEEFNTRERAFVEQTRLLQEERDNSAKERQDFRRTLADSGDLRKFDEGIAAQFDKAQKWKEEQASAMTPRWENVLQPERQQTQQTTQTISDAELDSLLEELGRRSSKPLPPIPNSSSQTQEPNQPPSYEQAVASTKQGMTQADQQSYDAARTAFQEGKDTARDQQILDINSANSRITGAARVSQQQTTGGPEKGDLRGGGQGGYAAAVQANAQQQSQSTTQQPKQEQQTAKSEPTKAEPEKRTIMGSERMFKAFTANRFVTSHDGKVNDTYRPDTSQGPLKTALSAVGNGFKAAMNFVGAGIKTATSLLGDGLKKVGELAGKPFEKARDMIDRPGAFNKIVGSIAMVAATPLKAVGMASSITGAAVESVGEVAKNACGLVGAVGRGVLSLGTAGNIMRDIGSEFTKTVASVAHVATDVAKQVGTELKELGNQAGIPVVSQALRVVGASVQGVAQAGEGIIQGTRKLAVGEVKEAAKVLASGVASGAKTVGKETYHAAGTELFSSERRSLSGRDTTYSSQTRSEAEQVKISGLSNEQRQEAARAGSQGAKHMRNTTDKSVETDYAESKVEHKQNKLETQTTAKNADKRTSAVAEAKGLLSSAQGVTAQNSTSKVNAYRFSQAQQQNTDKGPSR